MQDYENIAKGEAIDQSREQYFEKYHKGLQQLVDHMSNATKYGEQTLANVVIPDTYEEFAARIPITRQDQVRDKPNDFVASDEEQLHKMDSGGTSGTAKEFYWPASDFLVEFTDEVRELIEDANNPVSIHGDWESSDFQVIDTSLKAIRQDIALEKFFTPEQFLVALAGHDVAFYEEDAQSLKTFLFGLQKLRNANSPLLENLRGVKFILEPGTEAIPFSDLQDWFNIFYELTGVDPNIYVHYSQTDSALIGLYRYEPSHTIADYKYKVSNRRFVELIDTKTGAPVSKGEGAIISTTFRKSGTILMRYDTGDKGEIEYSTDGDVYLRNIDRREDQGMIALWGSKLFVPEIYDRLAVALTDLPLRIAFSVEAVDELELEKVINMVVYIPELATDEEADRVNTAILRLTDELKTVGNEDIRPFFANETGKGARLRLESSIVRSNNPPIHKRWSIQK